jgi:hypothetical protein
MLYGNNQILILEGKYSAGLCWLGLKRSMDVRSG